jgi:uncharacterized membrane protein
MSERKLKAWQDAGLIDTQTADRLRVWEAENARPIGVWAIVGLGALTIGLGIILIVAANWDAIPGTLRLAVHLVLMAVLAAWLGWALLKDKLHELVSDSAILVVAILGLTFFAHLGQVYQTSSPLWQPLLGWLILFSPLMLLFGRSWPVGYLWMAAALGTAWAHASEYGDSWMWGRHAIPPAHPVIYWGLICCPPMVVAAASAALRRRGARSLFWRLLEQLSVATILISLSLLIIFRGLEDHWHTYFGSVAIQSMALIAAAAVTFNVRPTHSGRATAAILGVAGLVHLGQSLLLDLSERPGGPWSSSVFLLILWGSIAGAARYAGWRDIFQVAIGLIALRIILLGLELNDDLLTNGVGLIISGGFAMLIAWATVQISKRYAPVREKAGG